MNEIENPRIPQIYEWSDIVDKVREFLLREVPKEVQTTVGLMVDSRIETIAQDVNTICLAYRLGADSQEKSERTQCETG